MFLGNYTQKLDIKKGRTAIPSRFRQLLGKKAIITKGYEGSLILVSSISWTKLVEKAINKSILSGPSRQADRFLLGNAFEIEFDKQGRFILPVALRNYAKLGKSIIFAGVGNRIEIWDKTAWQKQQNYLTENIAQISEKLDEQNRR